MTAAALDAPLLDWINVGGCGSRLSGRATVQPLLSSLAKPFNPMKSTYGDCQDRPTSAVHRRTYHALLLWKVPQVYNHAHG
jgi:hypothetical protein